MSSRKTSDGLPYLSALRWNAERTRAATLTVMCVSNCGVGGIEFLA